MDAAQEKLWYTYEHYVLLPEEKRYELIGGDFYMTPAPLEYHQRVQMRLLYELYRFIDENGLGRLYPAPVDVSLSDFDTVQPDILFIAKEREGIIKRERVIGAPDLVIEILSPENPGRDQVLKRRLYERYGVKEYWIVNPKSRSVEILTLTEKGFETYRVFPENLTLDSLLLPGLKVELKKVFK